MAKKAGLSDKLAKLQEKLANTDTGGGGNAGFWSPPQGQSMIRILPEVGEMAYFFQEVGTHRLPDNTQIKCPSFTSTGEQDCPICELVSELYKGSEADKKLAGQLRVGKKYWMNIIVRDVDKDTGGDTYSGPFIFTPGVLIFKDVVALINTPDYGDITDEEIGCDLIITRKGEKLDTEYSVQPRRKDCPLHVDEKILDEILDSAADLSYVTLTEDPADDETVGKGFIIKLLPYDRIVDEYGLQPGMSAKELDKALAARNDDGKSVRDAISRRKAPAVEPEEDEVEEAFSTSRNSSRTRRSR